ncbi:MAG: hypothetical protein AAGD32_16235 [Planctomycetota bacterium]
MPDTLNYAEAEANERERPRFVLRLITLIGVAAIVSELHYAVRPATLTWERWWVYGTLPLLVLAGLSSVMRYPRERVWLTIAALGAIGVACIPIAESWDAVTTAFQQRTSFGFRMIVQQLRNQVEPLVLILAAITLVLTVTVFRLKDVGGLRSMSLVVVCVPVTFVFANAGYAYAASVRLMVERQVELSLLAGSCLWIALLLCLLPFTRGRFATTIATGLVGGCAVNLATWAFVIIHTLGFEELFRLRMLSNTLGRLGLAAAPAIAVLVSRSK